MGWIWRSNSPYLSPAFIILKPDRTVLPRWVNDYQHINSNMVTDNYPLPQIDNILADCAKGRIWGKINLTNSFFQTRMHPDHIKYIAVMTPQGAFKWTVMPMGFKNVPSTHQRWMNDALWGLIGKICHCYINNIIIWSNTIEEHKTNIKMIMEALRHAELLCSPKKMLLFLMEVDFLEHHISAWGIEADAGKVEKILNWNLLWSAKEVHAFLGLVQYISIFLPNWQSWQVF